jgi:hypothetical protein
MGQQQSATVCHEPPSGIRLEVAAAATRYQAFREVEAEHLARMARHDLAADWTPDVRVTVLAARDVVGAARDARADFRGEVRDLVVEMRSRRESLPAVLRLTRAMMQLLEHDGAIRGDGHWLEAEVLTWVIEDYETVA